MQMFHQLIVVLFIISVSLKLNAAAAQGNDDLRGFPPSFLYDGSPISLVVGGGTVNFDPKLVHKDLAAVRDTDKNVASFSLTYFFRKEDKLQYQTEISEQSSYAQGLVEGTDVCSPEELLGYLYMHTSRLLNSQGDEYSTNLITAFLEIGKKERKDIVAERNPRSRIQSLGHSEQCILADLHKLIQYKVSRFVLDEKPQNVYGMCLNVYTLNDCCSTCGSTIERVIPTLRNLSTTMLAALGQLDQQRVQDFFFFSTVSSSLHYKDSRAWKSYQRRPQIQTFEQTTHYSSLYAADGRIKKSLASKSGSDISGKILYFWTPRPEYVGLTKVNGKWRFKVERKEQLDFFNPFLNKDDPDNFRYQDVEEVDMAGSGLEFEWEDSPGKVSLAKLFDLPLKKLDLSGTQVKSPYLRRLGGYGAIDPTIFRSLLTLNLRGAIKEYKDGGGDDNRRGCLFWRLARLPVLTHLNLADNNVNADELWELVADNSLLPKLEELILVQNNIFKSKKEGLAGKLKQWSEAREPVFIDLKQQLDSDTRVCLEFIGHQSLKIKLDSSMSSVQDDENESI